MCVCVYACVCVCERERERESVCVCVRERESVCVCILIRTPGAVDMNTGGHIFHGQQRRTLLCNNSGTTKYTHRYTLSVSFSMSLPDAALLLREE